MESPDIGQHGHYCRKCLCRLVLYFLILYITLHVELVLIAGKKLVSPECKDWDK